MKNLTFISLLLLSAVTVTHAQDTESPRTGVGIGFHLVQNQQDFGLGLNLNSPYFANDQLAFRVRGNVLWNQHLDGTGTNTWSHYTNLSLGVIGVGGTVGGFLRLYGEGGVVLLLPNGAFSSESSEFGGYGLFGFEFFMNSLSNYFIEIGGIGTGATADRVASEPIYSNGLTISTGIRYVFK